MNLNNGNVNYINSNNNGFVRGGRLVPASECQGVTFDQLLAARAKARVGNYSSQSLANVYLNPFDQFVKHELGVEFYVRYVDDFLLIHSSREQLLEWKARIVRFLADELLLQLKDEGELHPLEHGIDFLGYVQFPTHRLVRPRVIQHAREKLFAWQQAHVRGGVITATPEAIAEVKAIWASYVGHFRHANSFRLIADFHQRFPWLAVGVDVKRTFAHELSGRPISLTFKEPKGQ